MNLNPMLYINSSGLLPAKLPLFHTEAIYMFETFQDFDSFLFYFRTRDTLLTSAGFISEQLYPEYLLHSCIPDKTAINN